MKDPRTTHLEVGTISKPHGVRGELKLRLYHRESVLFDFVESVVLQAPQKPAARYKIETARGGGAKGVILALAGVDSKDAAEGLRDSKVWVSRKSLPIEDDEYYLVDVIGCQVRYDDQPWGRVVDVRPDPSVDTLVIQKVTGEEVELPMVPAWIDDVDVKGGLVILSNLEGVIE
ncbi:MAG: ribosome maturation factor RimM [Polyangiaceae bacterium]|nr:ribosome maturation factor RimM [Polyangiaceae bacterium]